WPAHKKPRQRLFCRKDHGIIREFALIRAHIPYRPAFSMSHTVSFSGSGHTAAVPSRWRRFASMMYEGVLLFGVVFLAGYLFDTLTQSRSGLTLRGVRQGVLFLAIGVYFIMCWRYTGQTLPMKTWNIRLVDRNGRTPPLKRLILRYVLLWPIPL